MPAETFLNILTVDEESKRKLLTLISTDSFIKDNDVYDFSVEISIISR